MVRKFLGFIIILLLLPEGQGLCGSGKVFDTYNQVDPMYRSYFYNYPHAIPPDYVYRTGRLFSDPDGRMNTLMRERGISSSGRTATLSSGLAENLRLKIHLLAKQLLDNAAEDIADDYAVTVSTFVNLNRLYSTSSLGRYMAEQLINELQLAGVDVIEVRKTPGIMISEGHGEYGMSRDMDELSFVQYAQAMVAGTYTLTDREIFVNARLLNNGDGMVLSTASLVFAIDPVAQKLLMDEGMPARPGKPVKLRAFNE